MKNKILIITLSVCLSLSLLKAFAQVSKLPSDYKTGVTWEQAVKQDKPIAINFYADWCGYCKRFAPVLDTLSKKYKDKINFVLINTDNPANEELVREFNIRSFPSFYLVNPKTDTKIFVNQSLYRDTDAMTKELDKFLNSCQ